MRASRFLNLILGLCYWSLASLVFAQTPVFEHISHADITVHFDKDGSLKIREEIEYYKPKDIHKRGIFRELPTQVLDGVVKTNKSYRLTQATRNGLKETTQETKTNNTLVWRLGRADVYLNEGLHRYVLDYETDDWIFRYEDLDEVRWNVWGEYWDIPVQKLTGRFIFPEGASAKQIKAYSGAYGRTGNDITTTERGNIIEFSADKILAPREAVTLSAGFDKGVFDPLTSAEVLTAWLRKNGALLILSLLTLGVSAFYFLNWSKVGRDPVKPPVFARYEAPKNYSSAAAHWVLNKGQDDELALISTLLSLAIKKYIQIDVTKKQTTLTRLPLTKQEIAPLNREESFLFAALFNSQKNQIQLRKNKPHRRFHTATSSFERHLQSLYSKSYHTNNQIYIVAGAALSVVGLMIAFAHLSQPASILFWGLILAVIFINILFALLMPAPTKKGAEIKSEIEGFKLYLETAEKLHLNSADIGTDRVPSMTQERYEAFLPYAVALDVEKPWTTHFEKTLPAIAKTYSPTYYSSYRGGNIGRGGIGGMNRDMVKALSSGVASARPVQTSNSGRSSSSRSFSSGGGFSGGGGGGGGGGSW